MLRSAIAFMFGKIVLGVPAVIFDHQSIARHLGNNRGRRNGAGESIAFDNGALSEPRARESQASNSRKSGVERQCLYGAPHRQPGRFEDIQAVDLRLTRGSDADAPSPTNDFGEQPDTFRLADLFGIVQSSQADSDAAKPLPPQQRDRREAHVQPHQDRQCAGTRSIWPPPRTLRWGPLSSGSECQPNVRLCLAVKWKSARTIDQAFAAVAVSAASSLAATCALLSTLNSRSSTFANLPFFVRR